VRTYRSANPETDYARDCTVQSRAESVSSFALRFVLSAWMPSHTLYLNGLRAKQGLC
jgi:hypothetical protein